MPTETTANPLIGDALRAIADGAPLPWRDLDDAPLAPSQVEALRTLDDIAAAYRANAAAVPRPDRRNVLFRWGALEVEQAIGAGSFGEVYRAFDPWLGRHVALKLFHGAIDGAGLDEARRLARLRHRNVLGVYGCGIHDGRAGLWSELIEGRTLAAAVAAEGAFSVEETLRVGRALAQALAAVHAAGLVHGDIKADNVMRESGGRVVLMDFGAGGDTRLLASQRLISGTPRYLPPEVLDGAPLGVSSDIYAFGVLLYLLLSGRHPYLSTDAAALREEQRRGERPSLHELRPELGQPLCALVESCLATDPAQRPANAQALDAKLEALLHAATPATSGARRLPVIALALALAALLAVAAVLAQRHFSPPPWDSSVAFLRVGPDGDSELQADATLRVGDRLRMALRSSRDVHVYVLNEDAAGNATVLFPLQGDDAVAPTHAGSTLSLPGGEGSTLAWEVTADSAREEFVVVASLVPQPALDRVLSGWRRAATETADTRSVGAVVDAPAPLVRGEHLRELLATLGRDPQHVRVWQYRFAHGG